ncbi:MAG: hypothetical protein N3B01_03790 [Verrucomicrobiae bacterium]|nr:hypothetical protein [Verrucomicrobiae bacterium]
MLLVVALFACCAAASAALRLGVFRCDVTPPFGEPMVWDVPLQRIETPLLAKGVVLEDNGTRCVLVAFDWCIIANESDWALRELIARAARTEPSRVFVHSVHQHDAPYADAGAWRLLREAPKPPPHLSAKFMADLNKRLQRAVEQAARYMDPFDRIGAGEARVERVASERRLKGPDGKIITRGSEGAKNPKLAAMPEGDIDPFVKTITIARGDKPLVRLHYYATHPQTISCTGDATADFVGLARETLEQEEGVIQIYFTGCAGNITVGKYNDTTPEARNGLAERLLAGMKAAVAATRLVPAEKLLWRTEELLLPIRTDSEFVEQGRRWLNDPKAAPGLRIYRGAMRLASVERANRPFLLSSLQIGDVYIVNLPGEPLLEFQRFAQRCRPHSFVAVAGYGDGGTGYVCTDEAFREGGYEPTASNLAPGAETSLKAAVRRLLGK